MSAPWLPATSASPPQEKKIDHQCHRLDWLIIMGAAAANRRWRRLQEEKEEGVGAGGDVVAKRIISALTEIKRREPSPCSNKTRNKTSVKVGKIT